MQSILNNPALGYSGPGMDKRSPLPPAGQTRWRAEYAGTKYGVFRTATVHAGSAVELLAKLADVDRGMGLKVWRDGQPFACYGCQSQNTAGEWRGMNTTEDECIRTIFKAVKEEEKSA